MFSKLRMFSDQSCVNRTEAVHGTFRTLPFLFFHVFLLSPIRPIVWNMCENLHCGSVYFKGLHNDQEYYWPTISRAGAAVASGSRLRDSGEKLFSKKKCEKRAGAARAAVVLSIQSRQTANYLSC